jgi:MOSC domain-containing protein YiiM
VSDSVTIRHIFISPGHNFFGRYGQTAGSYEIQDVASVNCRAGWGIEGDRFYGYRPEYKGQVTFFDWETFRLAREKFGVPQLSASVFRRNVVIEGLDLNTLIGRRFTLGGVEFEGTTEARPCHWMNQVVAPGAEDWLCGRGGLRTKVLTDGVLAAGPVDVWLAQAVAGTEEARFQPDLF